jgi:hypothetical protein
VRRIFPSLETGGVFAKTVGDAEELSVDLRRLNQRWRSCSSLKPIPPCSSVGVAAIWVPISER